MVSSRSKTQQTQTKGFAAGSRLSMKEPTSETRNEKLAGITQTKMITNYWHSKPTSFAGT
jgi:hypothetical protein